MSFSNSLGEWLTFFAKVFCGVIIAMGLGFTVYSIGPSFEQKYFPVVSKLTMINVSSDEEGHAVLMAEFNKMRNCEYLGIAWYRGTQSQGFERVPVMLLRSAGDRSSPNRPTGRQRSGPWVIHMPVNEIDGNSFAQLFHRCHPFWTSTTDFWP